MPSSVSQSGRDNVLGSLVVVLRAERFASGAAPPPTELKLAREAGERLGGFTSEADVLAQLKTQC